MINITSFSPLENAFESLVRGVPMWQDNTETRAPAQFRIDVTENEKEYQVLAEMPGIKKEEIAITIDGIEVVISAEVKRAGNVKDGKTVLHAERYYGKIQRELAFSQAIDDATAQAKYNDGVLELTLPKKTVAATRRLAVN